MPSLAILEGLIGTGCAVACLYYARLGALAGPQNYVQAQVPWHSALGEYARRNPFAVVFGALAFGFLVSSWSMYALPRPGNVEPRVVEKWRTIAKNVPTPDPAQAAKIAALQTTINTDTATIAAQTAEINRLKQLIGKSPRRSGRRSFTTTGANPGGTAADLNRTFNPANAATGTTAPATAPQPVPTQGPATAPASEPPAQSPTAATPNSAPQSPSTTPPH
ncbi:MAG TPA: hypothetical protein VKR31_04660 [Rhizomicrobium sp.]|nr:hypothetical protein [Rhizomicrobium sp.]